MPGPHWAPGGTCLRLITILALAALLAPFASAFHEGCPATPTNFTLRVGEGGFYVLGAEVYQESNGHSGLQQGMLPTGCAPDTRLA